MKRFSLLFVILILCFFLIGCQLTSFSPAVESTPVLYFDGFNSPDSDWIEENCAGKANWLGTESVALAYGYTTDLDRFSNPTTVTSYITPAITVGNYIVNFTFINEYNNTTVYKDGVYVKGDERDEAIKQALQKIKGVSILKFTYQMEDEGDGVTSFYGFQCSIP